MHHIVDLLQLAHANNLEGRIDEPAAEEVNRLARILAVANIGPLDRLHANDRLEDRCTEVRTSGQTNGDDGAAGPEVLGRLLERLLVDGDQNDGVGPEAVLGGRLDVLDDVGGLGKVDEGVGAELLDHGLLLVARVDADDLEAHGFGVLARERAETSAGTDNGDGLAGASVRLLESLVDGDTCAEDGGDGVEGDVFGYSGNVGGFGDGVLLEGTVDCVAGEEGFGAERLVPCLAEVTGQA